MAKQRQRKVLTPRKADRRDEDTLLVRSAESLMRVIGSLQRQIHDVLPAAGSRSKATTQRASPKSGVGKRARAKSASPAASSKPAARKTSRSRKSAHAYKK